MQIERPSGQGVELRPPRVRVDGRFLSLDGEPFRVRGVTYGSFGRRSDGEPFPEAPRLERDLQAIAAAGLNVVRTYAPPPPDFLDAAAELGLQVIAGVYYDDWRMASATGRRVDARVLDAGRRAVAEALERCAGRPEVLALSVGNEIPGDLVRVHGIHTVERTLSRLVRDVHDGDPELLATYTNYPTTEYLHIEGQDFASFNVFLERPEQLRPYLQHLQIAVGEVPLVLTELGLASEVHGLERQADSLEWQLRLVDETGCAGAAVFAWTDEWTVDGKSVTGWGFGITDHERRPKPALDVVERWTRSTLVELRDRWPRVTAVVCAYNAERTIAECLAALTACDYPDLEIVVCDDGSTDGTRELARRFPVRLLELRHGGLSAARNEAIAAAAGEIVAFVDADARIHCEWPYHLALSLEAPDLAATGGPNVPVPEAGFTERAVAASPGSPVEVLLSDNRAEHVPGCNMAFRREALAEIGGFDTAYITAGDDVDVCWKLLDRGWQIGYSPAAQVLHHRRATVSGFLRQQRGYGRSERLVAHAHPERFNELGQARWAGFIYGGPRLFRRLLQPIVYHGSRGSAPFQTVIRRRSQPLFAHLATVIPLAPLVLLLGLLAPLAWEFALVPPLVLALLLGYATAVAVSTRPGRHEPRPLRFRLLVACLHLAQPLARAWGRFLPSHASPPAPAPRARHRWSGNREAWLDALSRELATRGLAPCPAGPHERYDLWAVGGRLVGCRITTAVVWSWTPVARLQLRPRALLIGAAAVALVAGLVEVRLFPALALLALAGFLQAARTHRDVQEAIAATTLSAAAAAAAAPPQQELRPGKPVGALVE